jgi:hypothetical protein
MPWTWPLLLLHHLQEKEGKYFNQHWPETRPDCKRLTTVTCDTRFRWISSSGPASHKQTWWAQPHMPSPCRDGSWSKRGILMDESEPGEGWGIGDGQDLLSEGSPEQRAVAVSSGDLDQGLHSAHKISDLGPAMTSAHRVLLSASPYPTPSSIS